MTAATSLYTALSSAAGLKALVSNGTSPETYRIYPLVMEQGATRPSVVYQQITGTRYPTLSDAGGSGVEAINYQITSWATTYLAADAVAEQVRLAMNAATGFTVTTQPEKRDYFEDDTRLYAVEYDFLIHHR